MEHFIFEELRKKIAYKLDVDIEDVTDDANFMLDLEADSLDCVELVMIVESDFNIRIPDSDAEKIQTFGDIKYYISNIRKDGKF